MKILDKTDSSKKQFFTSILALGVFAIAGTMIMTLIKYFIWLWNVIPY